MKKGPAGPFFDVEVGFALSPAVVRKAISFRLSLCEFPPEPKDLRLKPQQAASRVAREQAWVQLRWQLELVQFWLDQS